MAVSMHKGYVRLGVLLSVIWVVIVAAVAAQESQQNPKYCGMTDVAAPPGCHQFFWAWEAPDTGKPQAAQEPKDKGLHFHFGKIALDVEAAQPLEHRFKFPRLILALFGPLAAVWGLTFGIAWCADGFKKEKPKS